MQLSFRHAATQSIWRFVELGMNIDDIKGRLAFLQEAEKLKSVLRSSHTSTGRAESTAEHTWRLCLMAMTFADELAGMDMLKILKMCLVHDLGEAIHGDIPAIEKNQHPDKSAQEKTDLLHLTRSLEETHRVPSLRFGRSMRMHQHPKQKLSKRWISLKQSFSTTRGSTRLISTTSSI